MTSKSFIYITSRRLLPLNSGDKLLTFNILKRISKRYDIYLFNLNEGLEYTQNEIITINKVAKKFKVLSFRNKHSLHKILKSFIFNKMYWKLKIQDERIEQELSIFIDSHRNADSIIWDHLRSSLFFVENKSKNILIEHNNEADAIISRLKRTKNILLKNFLNKQTNIMLEYIETIHKKMDRIIYLSQNDFQSLEKEYPQKYRLMNQLILNFSHASYQVKKQTHVTKLLFIGSLDWYPNIEAIQWFLKDIFPLLQKECDCQFDIVGRNPDKKLIKYINSVPNASLHSNVPSVEEFYLNSDIVVIPIRSGSGINIKVLEALSYGIPIVMTSFAKRGYEGLQFIKNIETPHEFIHEIKKLQNIETRIILHNQELEYYKLYQAQSDEIISNLFL